MANFEWTTASCAELAQWSATRHYQSDVKASDQENAPLRFHCNIATDGVTTISHSSGSGKFDIRRAWTHIRRAPVKSYNVYFPLHRDIGFAQDGATGRAGPGDTFILYGDRPLAISSQGDQHQPWQVLIISLPAHAVRDALPTIDRACGQTFDVSRGVGKLARDTFLSILDTSRDYDQQTFARVSAHALAMYSEAITSAVDATASSSGLVNASLDRVKRYVEQHLAEQSLAVSDVARGCGISQRYVHLLMSQSGESFGQYLWRKRLDQANRWLHSAEHDHLPIEHIAALVGFKSSSHFTRLFKTKYGAAPSAVRKRRKLPQPMRDQSLAL